MLLSARQYKGNRPFRLYSTRINDKKTFNVCNKIKKVEVNEGEGLNEVVNGQQRNGSGDQIDVVADAEKVLEVLKDAVENVNVVESEMDVLKEDDSEFRKWLMSSELGKQKGKVENGIFKSKPDKKTECLKPNNEIDALKNKSKKNIDETKFSGKKVTLKDEKEEEEEIGVKVENIKVTQALVSGSKERTDSQTTNKKVTNGQLTNGNITRGPLKNVNSTITPPTNGSVTKATLVPTFHLDDLGHVASEHDFKVVNYRKKQRSEAANHKAHSEAREKKSYNRVGRPRRSVRNGIGGVVDRAVAKGGEEEVVRNSSLRKSTFNGVKSYKECVLTKRSGAFESSKRSDSDSHSSSSSFDHPSSLSSLSPPSSLSSPSPSSLSASPTPPPPTHLAPPPRNGVVASSTPSVPATSNNTTSPASTISAPTSITTSQTSTTTTLSTSINNTSLVSTTTTLQTTTSFPSTTPSSTIPLSSAASSSAPPLPTTVTDPPPSITNSPPSITNLPTTTAPSTTTSLLSSSPSTLTSTSIPSTAAVTIQVTTSSTATSTAIAPTATSTSTAVAPTATSTSTAVASTATSTSTAVASIASTSTAVASIASTSTAVASIASTSAASLSTTSSITTTTTTTIPAISVDSNIIRTSTLNPSAPPFVSYSTIINAKHLACKEESPFSRDKTSTQASQPTPLQNNRHKRIVGDDEITQQSRTNKAPQQSSNKKTTKEHSNKKIQAKTPSSSGSPTPPPSIKHPSTPMQPPLQHPPTTSTSLLIDPATGEDGSRGAGKGVSFGPGCKELDSFHWTRQQSHHPSESQRQGGHVRRTLQAGLLATQTGL